MTNTFNPAILGGPAVGVYDPRQPTLLPNFNRPSANGSTIDPESPQAFLASNPRTNASVTAVIGGTITAGDTVSLTLSSTIFAAGSYSVTYTVLVADDVRSIAENLAALLQNTPELVASGVFTTMGGTSNESEIVVNWNGPIGNFATLTSSVTGSATETVTIANSGKLSGGAGPVIAAANFNFAYNGQIQSYFIGQPYNLGYDLITQMVAQGMPIA